MENLKFSQLALSEFKLDSTIDFCLNSLDNGMTLIGNSTDFCIMELMYSCDNMILLPYTIKYAAIPQDKPLTRLVKEVDFVKLYDCAKVQEGQELLLDPIYTAECSIEPPKPRALHAEILPTEHFNYCCVLTSYGVCEVFYKNILSEEWESLHTNLLNKLETDVFPTNVISSKIKTFQELKDYVNQYLITSFTWSQYHSELLIYLGTAAGYVVAFKFIESSQFIEYCHIKTTLDRISYITIHNNILLVGGDQGQVRLMKVDHNTSSLQEMDFLWSKKDRMSCRKAIISFSENLNSYLVVFCKGAHVLLYRLDQEGSIMSNSSLYVSGIKITGLEMYAENEFIITTIMGTVKLLKAYCPTKEELKIEEHAIEHDLDSTNLQILGLGKTKSRNLWSFLLYRNKEYTHQSKNSPTTAFLNVSKLSSYNSLTKIINMNLKNMDIVKDLVVAINLDIFNNLEMQQYNEYLPLEKLKCPKYTNDAFLQKLQIKLMIVRKSAIFQKIKYKKQKAQNILEFELLENIIQLLNILDRLQYLQKIYSSDVKLSSFQELSIACMQTQYEQLLRDLVSISNNEENFLHKTAQQLSVLITEEFEKCKFQIEKLKYKTEHCSICNEAIGATTFNKCAQEHDIKRCSLSHTQLQIFYTKYCPYCNAFYRNDNDVDLQELIPKDECVKCIFCRFLLREDNF